MSSSGQTRPVIGSGPVVLSGGLPAPHAFTTREGGISAPPFATLNFGNPGELPPGVARDPKPNIEENFRRVLAAIRGAGRRIVQVHQVHGAAVHVEKASPERERAGLPPVIWGDVKADAIVTDDPSCVVVVRVADCCPVLLASEDGRVVGAVHAGWRGVIAGVAPAAAEAMRELGAAKLLAAIGPCISAAHFEVGPEVVEEFRRRLGPSAPISRESPGTGKAFIDLQAALERQLREAGVERTARIARCTFAEADAFFSHRRDRGVTGRMIGVIGPVG